MLKHKLKRNNKGFTLLEMLISLTIFSAVVIISLASVVTVVEVNKTSRALSSGVNDFNFAFESMTRTIKSGINPVASANSLTIDGFAKGSKINDSRVKITYRLGTNTNGTGSIEKQVGNGPFLPITSPHMNITGLKFQVVRVEQPRVRINLAGMISNNIDTKFDIQTMVSQRNVEF